MSRYDELGSEFDIWRKLWQQSRETMLCLLLIFAWPSGSFSFSGILSELWLTGKWWRSVWSAELRQGPWSNWSSHKGYHRHNYRSILLFWVDISRRTQNKLYHIENRTVSCKEQYKLLLQRPISSLLLSMSNSSISEASQQECIVGPWSGIIKNCSTW